MKRITIFFSLILLVMTQATQAQYFFDYSKKINKEFDADKDYVPGVIIFKVKGTYRANCLYAEVDLPEFKKVFKEFGHEEVHKKFPNHTPPTEAKNSIGQKNVDLSLIYEYHYSSKVPIQKVINSLLETGMLEYAEPHYIPELFYLPNDPFADTASASFNLYQLVNARILEGWDVDKGDSTVVIAIVDTGTDTDHGDLMDNIAYNTLDPIDGLDNDNDGFVDNYQGWDLGEFDNDPNVNTIVHGIHVSGISSAKTDNNVGIAGSGFQCKFLPVKVDDENGVLTMSYEGIVYAADHGCKIINCSWGTKSGNGNFGQDIVNYATINRDALVLAAAGNDNDEGVYYPASYRNVLSIAGTDIDDHKYISEGGSGSNFNTYVDLAAPGKDIYSTLNANSYGYSSGTSMAAPVAAGLAAIVKNHFPNYSAIQVGEQLRVTCDNIDTVEANAEYAGFLGKGRVNLFRALTETEWPSIRLMELSESSEYFYAIKPGDSFEISCQFINYLDTVSGLSIKLSTKNAYVTFLDSVYSPNIAYTLEPFNNESDPFELVLDSETPLDEEIVFRLDYSNGTYSDFEYFSVIMNADFIDLDTNNILASLNSSGRLVYQGEFEPLDLGFMYKNRENILSCGGLMLGEASNKVSDNVYGSNNNVDRDFASKFPIRFVENPLVADMEAYSEFNDSLASFASLEVKVNQRAYAWDNSGDDDYIILDFEIINEGDASLYPLYTGFFADWDIDMSSHNQATIDEERKLAYIFPVDGGVHAGVKLLTGGGFHHYAIDNDGAGGAVNFFDLDGFTTYEKFLSLSNDRVEAGASSSGNDVSHVISAGPLSLAAGDTTHVAFALVAGDYLVDLQGNADNAQQKYTNLISVDDLDDPAGDVEVYPNPFAEEINVNIYAEFIHAIELLDNNGRLVYAYTPKSKIRKLRLDVEQLKSGYYLMRIITANNTLMKKLIKK